MQNADLVLSNHNLVMLSGKEALKQKMEHRIRLYLGEFLLEPDEGINWFQLFELKNPKDAIKETILREMKLEPDILAVTDLTLTAAITTEQSQRLNFKKRTLKISYRCDTTFGQIQGDLNI